MNLLSNAVKYTPSGGSIHVALEQLPGVRPECMRLRITVADTGIGIAKEFQPHLFEAFSRERDSSESGIIGTGLGLHIVKSFADLMDGTAAVESAPGQGSRFTVELPLRLLQKQDAPSSEDAAISLSGKRVLLTEDNALNAEITATILQDAGVMVETAENGAAAIAMLQAAPIGYYDLILMDIQMPCMNGYQATKAIRALPDARSKILIVAMTANAFDEDRQAALDAGMDDYASKPIEAEKMRHIISEALHRCRE